jgi:hypothetical protein
MSAGSGEGRPSVDRIQEVPRDGGVKRVTAVSPATLGSEQQLQKWQFGGHCPPETSVGQLSSQGPSPHSAASPLMSNVSRARKTIRTARRTPTVSHRSRSAGIDPPTGFSQWRWLWREPSRRPV